MKHIDFVNQRHISMFGTIFPHDFMVSDNTMHNFRHKHDSIYKNG